MSLLALPIMSPLSCNINLICYDFRVLLLETVRDKLRTNFASIKKYEGFRGGSVVENPPANAGDMGSCPGLGRSHMPRSN